MISVYHAPAIGPDGLCTLAGCRRVRAAHIPPDPKPKVRYVSDGPCRTHRIVNCPCVGPIADND